MAKAKGSKNLLSWERQPNESAQAYEAFYLYLQMGGERTLRKVEQQLNKSHALIGRWSSMWEWPKRVRDYENDLRRQEFEEKKLAIKKMQDRQIQTAMLLQKKAVKALDSLKYLSAKDIARFLSLGTKLEKETRQESISDFGENGPGQTASLADTIISAYKNRMEGDGE